MRDCYHGTCDTPSNPSVNVTSNIEFLSKTVQALVLSVAELSGGVEGCAEEFGRLVKDQEKEQEQEDVKETEPPAMMLPEVKPDEDENVEQGNKMVDVDMQNEIPEVDAPLTAAKIKGQQQQHPFNHFLYNMFPNPFLPYNNWPKWAQTPLAPPQSHQQEQRIGGGDHQALPRRRNFIPRMNELSRPDDDKVSASAEQQPSVYMPNYGNQFNIEQLTLNMGDGDFNVASGKSKAKTKKRKGEDKEEADEYIEEEEEVEEEDSDESPAAATATELLREYALVLPPQEEEEEEVEEDDDYYGDYGERYEPGGKDEGQKAS